MTGKILRNSVLVAALALFSCALLFFGVMYRNYEDQAFSQLRAEAAAVSQGLNAQGERYLDDFEPADRVTWVSSDGTAPRRPR